MYDVRWLMYDVREKTPSRSPRGEKVREDSMMRDIVCYTCYSVTVPKTIGEGQKLTLYLYINIEVFLGYGKTLSRTVTLKHCNATEKNRKKFGDLFVDRNENVLPLHCQ